MLYRTTTLFAGLLLLASTTPLDASSSAPRIEQGLPFPSIVLPALDGGRPASLADFRGEKVVLHIFASW